MATTGGPHWRCVWGLVRRKTFRKSRGPPCLTRPGATHSVVYFLPGPVEAFLRKKLEEEPEVFDQNYLVAISFDDVENHTVVTALFNNQAYHSTAQALALVDNVLFKLLSGPRASITVLNHPQPESSMETTEDILYEYVWLSFLLAELLPLPPASSRFVSLF